MHSLIREHLRGTHATEYRVDLIQRLDYVLLQFGQELECIRFHSHIEDETEFLWTKQQYELLPGSAYWCACVSAPPHCMCASFPFHGCFVIPTSILSLGPILLYNDYTQPELPFVHWRRPECKVCSSPCRWRTSDDHRTDHLRSRASFSSAVSSACRLQLLSWPNVHHES
jgi:hypothetical protein